MLTVYEERVMQRGIAIGEQRGIAIGTVRGKRETTLRLLRKKFGALPKAIEARIQAMETEAELDALLDAALDVQSLDDLGFKKKKRTANRS